MIRQKLSDIFNELKEDNGFSYRYIAEVTGLTHKQISAIIKGENGVCVDRICTVIEELFAVKIEVSYEDSF